MLALDMTHSFYGYLALGIFVLAYGFVMVEEFLHLRKSKPVLLAAGLIWMIIAFVARSKGLSHEVEAAVRHDVLEYAELFLFLLVAMTYVNTLEERGVFGALKCWLVKREYTFKQLFWITGFLAFFLSPIADNLTTALVMGTVIMSVGSTHPKFVTLSCINIVVAANAGGAFSPFGDITTLMVWQKEILPFQDFFKLFFPSLVNFIVPAVCLSFAIPHARPQIREANVVMAEGAKPMILLFLMTIGIAVFFHSYLTLPPMMGMMMGLGLLKIYSYYLRRRRLKHAPPEKQFDIFKRIEKIEWDTLLFFYGVVLCVGGLATIGYLSEVSQMIYTEWGQNLGPMYQAIPANILVGVLSAIVDNIPVMYAVLTMEPNMSQGQWLLVTLTAGVGGSLLAIGSAAGVGLLGQARGYYTFFGHLKWIWAIALGYIASIGCHLYLNQHLF